MNGDRELLEMAAKAAGINGVYSESIGEDWGRYSGRPGIAMNGDCWNPLTDDGAALRLAVKLGMVVQAFSEGFVAAFTIGGTVARMARKSDEEAFAAIRRAIVVAAAEVGRRMP